MAPLLPTLPAPSPTPPPRTSGLSGSHLEPGVLGGTSQPLSTPKGQSGEEARHGHVRVGQAVRRRQGWLRSELLREPQVGTSFGPMINLATVKSF